MANSGISLNLDATTLAPLIRQIVGEVLAQSNGDEAKANQGKLAYSEQEAGRLVGVPAHVIRDSRLRGELKASLVGKRIRILHADLLVFLEKRRWTQK